jgi:hypothetical protein
MEFAALPTFQAPDSADERSPPGAPRAADPETRRLMIGSLQHLETMGLAAPAGPGEWMVGLEAERSLRDLSMRGDIIKTIHRAFTDTGFERNVADYVIDTGEAASPIVGRHVDKGLHETGLPYLQTVTGDQVAGAYRQSLTLTSGRFAMIDNGLGFQLVPWSPPLEKQLGRHVAGVMNNSGGIGWTLGRNRGLGL